VTCAGRRRWRTPTSLPGRSLGLDRGRVMVAEAQSRLHLFRAVDGARTARLLLGNGLAAPSRLTVLADDHLCWLGPAGFDDRLAFLRPGERPRWIELDQAAVWIGAIAGRALVAGRDGTVRVHPGDVPLEWPFPVGESPRLDHRGVWIGERCHSWNLGE